MSVNLIRDDSSLILDTVPIPTAVQSDRTPQNTIGIESTMRDTIEAVVDRNFSYSHSYSFSFSYSPLPLPSSPSSSTSPTLVIESNV